ncbi:GNAT family N-acetyltransferase [Adhaeribacter radiodurans]|uniref:GNAT family N-acetyltransferase n=1 Tax=Adhaeribacter radiodurans TaxID=2745197 RepID=A0A7L7L962_9BACT|nr:GNAT family N-acetyltransferase [Adhaeribacter radiodurans]QMU29358.1 GNAT family N-acetyltransferase [Adhaeribacter radiodurans]
MTLILEYKIEKASPADFEEITVVWEASVRATHHFLTEADILFFRPLILNEYLKAINLFCIKNAEGKIEGFIGVLDDKIEMLFLEPSARGKGIGKKLVDFVIQNFKIIKVDVNEQNQQAVGFYKHIGFKVVSRWEVDNLGKPYPILSMELE